MRTTLTLDDDVAALLKRVLAGAKRASRSWSTRPCDRGSASSAPLRSARQTIERPRSTPGVASCQTSTISLRSSPSPRVTGTSDPRRRQRVGLRAQPLVFPARGSPDVAGRTAERSYSNRSAVAESARIRAGHVQSTGPRPSAVAVRSVASGGSVVGLPCGMDSASHRAPPRDPGRIAARVGRASRQPRSRRAPCCPRRRAWSYAVLDRWRLRSFSRTPLGESPGVGYWGSAAAVSLPATTGTISNSIRWDQLATQRCSSVTSSHSMS